ncbi:MAG TPA: FAD-dependent oxidoreductase [Sphingomonadaceae bacterium]|nr:FAD-dependent oxidoreductase [Sphingomonadaceae bacterium]
MTFAPPPGLSAAQFDRGLKAFVSVVGPKRVLATDEDRHTYLDPYALGDGLAHQPAAAVAPASAEEVQAIVRLANEHRIPLWPTARGKNLGYGGAAPVMPGTVVLDLGRMNRILEVDPHFGYCLIEPGVGFYDLYNYLRDNKIPLWMSVPGNAWGSVMGNALERGLGYTPYGDNASKICGMEVVLPTGEKMRTGMGAMAGSKAWQSYQHGFGPSWDQFLVQSNFGVVTKMGLWLMPEPEMTMRTKIELPKADDIGWAIDELAMLRLHNVVEHNFVFGNYLHDAAVFSQRDEWYQGPGAIPDAVAEKIMAHYGIGWWSFNLSLFGQEEVVKAKEKLLRRAMEPHLGKPLEFETWQRGDPIEKSSAGRPSVVALQIVNWRGGRGGHIGFSPVMPPDGKLATKQFRAMKARFEEYGLDYYTSFTMGARHINNVNLILYNRDDADMVSRAKGLFTTMIADAKAAGYGEYRTHIDFMNPVAASFDYEGGVMNRLNETVKNAIDPNGVIAPGKNGIWPRAYKGASA